MVKQILQIKEDTEDGYNKQNDVMMKGSNWEEIHYSWPESNIDIRWRIEPANKFARSFWKLIKVFITVDYIQIVRDREKYE